MNTTTFIICPFCFQKISECKLLYHHNKSHKNINIYDFFTKIYSNKIIDDIVEKYKNGYAIDELRFHSKNKINHSKLSSKAIIQILNFLDIPIRKLNESQKQLRRLKKLEQQSIQKYGVKNISQSVIIKKKKAETFIEHYGVDNIRKYKPFYDYVNKICIERYGKRRISGFENKTDEEKEIIINKIINTFIEKGLYSKNVWTSSLEKRFIKIFEENNIDFKLHFFIDKHPFDFLYKNSILIEINGDYWHCNPNKYDKSFKNRTGKTAEEIWKRDNEIKDIALKHKYKFITFWETDIKEMTDKEILDKLDSLLDSI